MPIIFNSVYFMLSVFIFSVEVAIALRVNSGFIRYTLGDVFASILVYCILKSFIKIKNTNLALIALGVSFIVEFAQAFNILERFGWSKNEWAVIILGSHFSTSDLLAYTIGILTFFYIEKTLIKQ